MTVPREHQMQSRAVVGPQSVAGDGARPLAETARHLCRTRTRTRARHPARSAAPGATPRPDARLPAAARLPFSTARLLPSTTEVVYGPQCRHPVMRVCGGPTTAAAFRTPRRVPLCASIARTATRIATRTATRTTTRTATLASPGRTHHRPQPRHLCLPLPQPHAHQARGKPCRNEPPARAHAQTHALIATGAICRTRTRTRTATHTRTRTPSALPAGVRPRPTTTRSATCTATRTTRTTYVPEWPEFDAAVGLVQSVPQPHGPIGTGAHLRPKGINGQ